MNIQDPTHGDPGQWTPAQTARLAAALERIERSVDALGHPIDKGIARAVAMLNELGINTQGSCEGHVGWATGGPYIDIVSKRYRAMKNESRAMKDDPSLGEAQARLREDMKVANAVEGKKILPVLDAFYKTRTTDYESRLGLWFFGEGINRIESGGGAFLKAENDPAAKAELLVKFQAEMKAFSDFLVAYEPMEAPTPRGLNAKLAQRHARQGDEGAGGSTSSKPLGPA